MPLQTHRIPGGGNRGHIKNQKNGHKSNTMGQTLSKGKRNRKPNQKKKTGCVKNSSIYHCPKSIDNNDSKLEEIMKPLLPLSIEATALETKLEETKVFHV